ncbi:MAG TPA: hypothetical protein VMT03_03540 [Polyangia bacterium]|nr:hypothetical protein [Polyangia bacterium]
MPPSQRHSIIAGTAVLALLGCGEGLTTPPDIQQVSGDVSAYGAPPDAAATIAFDDLSDDVGTRANTRTRTLIRSASAYAAFFGHAPPAAVDFSTEWVMFYAAGSQPTSGYGAAFMALLRAGSSLIAITELVSFGPSCPVADGASAPYALIKFAAQPGASPQFFKNDITNSCNPQPPADPCASVMCTGGTHCDSGKCIPDGTSCGGLAGTPCPGTGKCADDPYDGCDPAAGGADCPGICQCVQTLACKSGYVFNADPSVCACVPAPPDPCANVKCASGTQCQSGKCVPVCGPVCDIYCAYGNVPDANGCPTCMCKPAPTDPCATVDCSGGTHCDSGKCVSDGVSCGGFAGTPCPGTGKCADDPYDGCDPAAGGADCPGICTCIQTVACPSNTTFDSSPSVCACVTSSDPCPIEKCPAQSDGLPPAKPCPDGSTSGPVCMLISGACAWTATSCAGS